MPGVRSLSRLLSATTVSGELLLAPRPSRSAPTFFGGELGLARRSARRSPCGGSRSACPCSTGIADPGAPSARSRLRGGPRRRTSRSSRSWRSSRTRVSARRGRGRGRRASWASVGDREGGEARGQGGGFLREEHGEPPGDRWGRSVRAGRDSARGDRGRPVGRADRAIASTVVRSGRLTAGTASGTGRSRRRRGRRRGA